MVLDDFQLAGKVAIVTGCNTGLGQGMACALAQAGADIVGVNRTDLPVILPNLSRFFDASAGGAPLGFLV